MTSQDVIHASTSPRSASSRTWCRADTPANGSSPTKVGEYHLFCAEYCGAEHAGMIGSVIVMEPSEYQAWLSGTSAQ